MLFEKVRDIISDQLGVADIESITTETSMIKDLGADSLDAVEIIMALEDEFGVSVPDEEAENFKSIGDIVNYIESKIA
ncbi:MAG: acyl carrier protein [Tissierellaceae bacterium]